MFQLRELLDLCSPLFLLSPSHKNEKITSFVFKFCYKCLHSSGKTNVHFFFLESKKNLPYEMHLNFIFLMLVDYI